MQDASTSLLCLKKKVRNNTHVLIVHARELDTALCVEFLSLESVTLTQNTTEVQDIEEQNYLPAFKECRR